MAESPSEAGGGERAAPLWLRLLGAAAIALMGAGLVYALAIALANFDRIGV